jgi:hypothetical protein
MNTSKCLSIGLLSTVLLTGAAAIRADDERGGDSNHEDAQAEVRIGYSISPVKLNTQGKDHRLVGLGSYIINAQGGCNDCHTHPNYAPGGDPYVGQPEVINASEYLAGGRTFGPVTTSKNLTPDASGKPAGLTFQQFKKVLRTGRDPDELGPDGLPRILQVMPWPVYGKMTDTDLRAMYEYLRAIPSLPNNPAPGP